MHSYLEEFLFFFFLTIITNTMHDIKPIMTTAVTVPAIVGAGVELAEDDEPVNIIFTIKNYTKYIAVSYRDIIMIAMASS